MYSSVVFSLLFQNAEFILILSPSWFAVYTRLHFPMSLEILTWKCKRWQWHDLKDRLDASSSIYFRTTIYTDYNLYQMHMHTHTHSSDGISNVTGIHFFKSRFIKYSVHGCVTEDDAKMWICDLGVEARKQFECGCVFGSAFIKANQKSHSRTMFSLNM